MTHRTQTVDFLCVASSLLELDDTTDSARVIARRYMSLDRRRRVLQGGIKEAHELATRFSPLSAIGFHPPLSVAGADSLTIVMAEHLAINGLPLAMELDERCQPRGVPIQEVAAKLRGIFGHEPDTAKVLDLYSNFMAAAPARLAQHPMLRYSKIPGLLDRIAIARKHLEDGLCEALVDHRPPIFVAIVESKPLRRLLCRNESPNLMIGLSPDGLHIGGVACDTVAAGGCGLRMIYRRHLLKLSRRAVGLVYIQAMLDGWLGWTDRSRPRKFNYA